MSRTEAPAPKTSQALGKFAIIAILVTLALAGIGSLFASGSPDGLDSATRSGCTFNDQDEITGGECLARNAKEHELESSPLAGYAAKGVDGAAGTTIAGVVGVLVILLLGGALTWFYRRPSRRGPQPQQPADPQPPATP
jgi:cobalt/nickel transport protein